VTYIEDPFVEGEKIEMARLMHRIGSTGAVVIAGNNVYASRAANAQTAAAARTSNAIVLRANDAGTVTELLSTAANFVGGMDGANLIVGTESVEGMGENIVDIAVAIGARYIRAGGLLRSERAAIYQRLVSVNRDLESRGIIQAYPPAGAPSLPPPPPEPVVETTQKDQRKKK